MAASLKEKDKLWMESRRLPIDSYPETFVGAFEATFACLRDAGDTNKPYSMLQEILLKVSLFKKDALIQSSTLAILCSYMQDKSNAEKQDKVARHVRECLFTLADKSLLRFKLEDEDGDCYFRIHDLVLQYIQNKTETLWGPDGIRRMHTALLAAYVAAAEGTIGLQHIEKLRLEEPAAGCSAEKDRSDSGFQDDLERSVQRHSPCKDRPTISGSNTNSGKDQLGCSSCYENDQAIVLSYPWWNLDFSGDKYVYTNFIHHCTAMGEEFESFYIGLLCSFRWLQAKLNKTSLSEILSDFERPQFSPLHDAINKALLLHAPAIIRDKKQLGPVFLGSLSNLEIIGISDFLKDVRNQLFEDADSCFLPDRACISPPYGHVVKTYSAHNSTAVLGLGVLKDSSIVTTSGDGFVRLIDPITGGETCLGSDLTKHNDLVTCFGVNSSETLVVTAACDSVVKLWDLKGKCLRETFSNIHNRQIFSLVLSADGESGLTVSGDKTIKLWYLNDGSVQFTYAAHTDVVACACFTNLSEKETFFASCSYDKTVYLWRKNRPECPVTSCNPKLGVLYTLFFSRYQRQLYVGGKTGIGVLNFPSLEVRRILKGHEGGTFALCLARYESHSLLLSGGDDGWVKFWDVNDDHSLVFQAQIHSAAVRGIQCAFQENTMTIYTASVDQSVKQSCFSLSSLDNSSTQSHMPNHEGPVSAMTSASNERYAISVSWDRQVILWDSSNGTAVKVIGRHDDGDRITTVSSHGNRCFTGSQTGTLHIWNLEDESQNAAFSYVHPAAIGTLAALEGHPLIVGLCNGDIYVWDIQRPTQTAILRVIRTSQFGVRHLRVTPECSISALCDDAITTLSYERDYQEQQQHEIVTVKIKNMPPFPVVPLPKFKQIIIGFDEDSRLRTLILEIERNSKINSGLPKVEIATALAISEDQEHLVCGSDNGSVTIVTRHGKTLSTLPSVTGEVKCIELLPNATSVLVLTSEGDFVEYAQGKDGEAFPYCLQWTRTRWHIGAFHIDRVKAVSENLIAFVMHGDNLVQLWDLTSKALVLKLSAPSATKSILALQNGTLLTGSSDGRVCIWNLKDNGKALKPRIRANACHAPFGVEHLCRTPDQTLFLTASSDNKIGVHETVNGNLVRVISTQQHYGMRCISVSSDGKFVMCCHKDIFAQMIDLTTDIPSKQMLTYNTAWSRPRSCSGSRVFTEGPKCTINIADINSGDSMNLLGEQTQSKQYAYAHTRAVTAIVPYGDNHIITGSYDKSIILWLVPKHNIKESHSLCQFYFEHIVICLLVIGRKLCVGLKNGTVNFLNVQINKKKVSCESASIRK
ncbi:uncharacterized protein LOC106160424 [Lingula anatina]|uniref:Uncharacterized protein LOC106160424 n=1 Tax=Lingula anatina TaxID=7574 RepID=A0A1S3I542_LINAN|nr:uncharacterized protein LOC106160424 [Lingula anatina]|eukprot:XP_013392484.1 uncharacterized protein LOC106160424 [Lingula anatina]